MVGVRHLVPAFLLGALLECGNGTGQVGIVSSSVSVSGVMRDYFTTAPLAAVALTAEDHPGLVTTSAANGSYTFTFVSSTSTLRAVAALTNYRSTRNETLTIGSSAVAADLFAISLADATRQYTAVGLTPTANTGVVVVNLRDAAGQPREGIPVADIVLLDATQAPVGLGPFVFGVAGDVVPHSTLAVSTAFVGRSRVAFLDVPPGAYMLSVTIPGPQTVTASVVVTASGATLVQR
jgi:hypothetical protein